MNSEPMTHIGLIKHHLRECYQVFFETLPTFEQFHVQVFGNEQDVRQLYELSGDNLELLNSIASLSQNGFYYVDLRIYVINQVAPK